MSNPLMRGNIPSSNNPIELLNAFINGGGDSKQAMQMLLQKNPKINQAITQINNMRGNQSLQDFALQGAKQRGFDVEQIKNLARKMGAK